MANQLQHSLAFAVSHVAYCPSTNQALQETDLCSEETDDPHATRSNASIDELAHQLQHSLAFRSVAGTAAAFAVLLAAPHLQKADRGQAWQQGGPLTGCAAVNELAVVEELVGHAADGRVAPARGFCDQLAHAVCC